MSGIYMVSAQKPTAVNQSILGRVTSESDLNLVLTKNTLLEIYKVTAEGLKFAKQISIWGSVECLRLIRPKTNDDGTYDIITKSHGNLKETVSRASNYGFLSSIDTLNSLVSVKCYDGIIKFISFGNEGKNLNVTTMRMDDLNVMDTVFLHGYDKPTIGILCKTSNNLCFKVFEVDSRNKELSQVMCKKEFNDSHAFIIPVPEPCCGVIIVGSQSIHYLSNNIKEHFQIAPPQLMNGEITAHCRVDSNGFRYLLSSTTGELFILLLEHQETMSGNTKVTNLQLEVLGETSIADNVTYIDNGVVFIGSKMGDSQLIKLTEQANENKSFLQTLETYNNLGPILDMLVVDIEKQGQGQLITCSGSDVNGSLRIIRSGIGIQESANVELTGVKSLWPLKINSDEYHDHLVLSFYGYTKIFSFCGEEFEDIEMQSFDLSNQTIQCSNVCFNQIIQILSDSIRLVSCGDSKLVDKWMPSNNELISVASANQNQILCASRNKLYYLLIKDSSLELVHTIQLDYEVACLDLSPPISQHDTYLAQFCAVGLWTDISVRLLRLPTLEQICCEPLGGEIIPRSIVIEVLEKIVYLFVSLGDGAVISYVLGQDKFDLKDKRKVVLGTQPTILRKFHSNASNNVFACSDCPTVINTNNQKLMYSSVNLKQVDYMCELNSKYYPNSLALLTLGVLRIGTMDNIQKLHVRTIKLSETARRIAYQSETQTFGVITFRHDSINLMGELKPLRESASTLCQNQQLCTTELQKPMGSEASASKQHTHFDQIMQHSFLILDQNTFEVLHSVKFQLTEYACSVISTSFDVNSTNYYVVGTSYVSEDDPEPKFGRLVAFKLNDNKLIQVCEKEIKGAPNALQSYNGKLLVASNNVVKLFEFKNEQFNQLASFSDNIFVTHLKVKNDFILMGDVLRSCTVLVYRPDTNNFELVAKDYCPIWMASVEMLDDENFLLCDSFANLVTLRKDSGQSNEEDRKALQNHGCIHLGEQINVFRHGSLGMQQSSELFAANFHSTLLGGSVSGAIYIFSLITPSLFKILNELQTRLGKYITTAGKVQYDKWRLFETDRRSETSKNFIDGDLIESFLDLSDSEALNLVKDFKVENLNNATNEEFNPSYFTKMIEELSRIH